MTDIDRFEVYTRYHSHPLWRGTQEECHAYVKRHHMEGWVTIVPMHSKENDVADPGRMVPRHWPHGESVVQELVDEPLAKLAATRIERKCDEIKEMLLSKNKAYGNSAFNPRRCFSKLGPEDRLRVRLDDKLARIDSGNEDLNEDAILDMVGYLVLLLIQKESAK